MTPRLVNRVEERREEVSVVIRGGALEHGGDALEAHSGVDGRCGQGGKRAVGLTVEFHEHVVPDFYEPVAVALDAATHIFGAGQFWTTEIVNL